MFTKQLNSLLHYYSTKTGHKTDRLLTNQPYVCLFQTQMCWILGSPLVSFHSQCLAGLTRFIL